MTVDLNHTIWEQCAAIANALLRRFPSASDGVAHVVIGDNNFDEHYLADPIGEIEYTLAWRRLLWTTLEAGVSANLSLEFRRKFGNWPGANVNKSDEELAAILGALQLMQWLWENAR